MAVALKEGIYWVGAIDWNLRDFHGYVTGRGATYNSYLIVDEKIALIDTVKAPFAGEMMERVRAIIDPARIDYVICNHVEMDHSGSLPEVLKQLGPVKVLAAKMARTGLEKYFGNLPLETVSSGDTLSLGKRTLHFLETPMVHWPDSMFTYVPEEKLLFSMDGFGQHIATSGRFDDEVDVSQVMYEARKYYANLLTHLSPLIQGTLKKARELNLDIEMIAPSHGIIWRKDPGKIIQAYNDWSLYKAGEKIVVIYDTMWKSTEIMARVLTETISDAGVEAKMLKLRENHRSDVLADILDARGVLFGSPTLHRNLFPTVADLLCYLRGLKPQKKVAAAFGSFGWSGEAPQLITDALKEMELDVIEPGVRTQYVPDQDDRKQTAALAEKVVARVRDLDA